MVDLATNQGFHAFAQGHRSDQQATEVLLFGKSCEVIEQLNKVLAQLRSCR